MKTQKFINSNVLNSEYIGFNRISLIREFKSLVEEADFFFSDFEQEEIQATQHIILKMREIREILLLSSNLEIDDNTPISNALKNVAEGDNTVFSYYEVDIISSPYSSYTGTRLQKTMVNTIDKLKASYEGKDFFASFVYLSHLNEIMETSKVFINIDSADMSKSAGYNISKNFNMSWRDIVKENNKEKDNVDVDVKKAVKDNFNKLKSLFK